MSKWAHDMAIKTYEDIQKRKVLKKKRIEKGRRDAISHSIENMNRSRGIRNHIKNNNKVIISHM